MHSVGLRSQSKMSMIFSTLSRGGKMAFSEVNAFPWMLDISCTFGVQTTIDFSRWRLRSISNLIWGLCCLSNTLHGKGRDRRGWDGSTCSWDPGLSRVIFWCQNQKSWRILGTTYLQLGPWTRTTFSPSNILVHWAVSLPLWVTSRSGYMMK